MTDMVAGGRRAKARRPKRREMQKLIDAQKGGFKLEPWDWQFYAEQVRKAEYDLDESQVRPYFELDRVLQRRRVLRREQALRPHVQGAQGHPGLSARTCACSRCSTPTASRSALFYADYFARDNKSGGAWMDSFVDQIGAARHASRSSSTSRNFTEAGAPASRRC